MTTIRTDKSRYARDQFRLIRSLLDQYGLEAALEAISFCQHSKIYSANTMRDYLEHRAALSGKSPPVPSVPPIPVDSPKYPWGPRTSPAKRVVWGKEEQRNERALPYAAGRGIWSLRRRDCPEAPS